MEGFYNAITINPDTCTGCRHCMHSCPTNAIRISSGIAYINDDNCIGCGECYRVCPAKAIHVEQDQFELVDQFKYKIVIVPSIFYGQFGEDVNRNMVTLALRTLGFDKVHDVESSTSYLKEEFQKLHNDESLPRPLISGFCPAVVRLIQVRFPSLTDNIILRKTPADIAAILYKKQSIDQGIKEEDIGVFYITPCAAKIAAVKQPVGESVAAFDGTLNMDFAYNKVMLELSKNKGDICSISRRPTTPMQINWSITNGEASQMPGTALAIDGGDHVSEFLEHVEDGEYDNIDFLELRCCNQGCPGGILTVRNRFLAVHKLRSMASNSNDNDQYLFDFSEEHDYLDDKVKLSKVVPRSILKLAETPDEALLKVQEVQDITKSLPGFDCGACGTPSCQSLAEDIVMGKAKISHCVFVQKVMEKDKTIDPEKSYKIIEEIWGESRLDK